MNPVSAFEIAPITALYNPELLLRPVLTSAIRDPETGDVDYKDVNEVLASLPRTEVDLKDKYTAVAIATEGARVLGMMSLVVPDKRMYRFAKSPNPIELTNAYVLDTAQRRGVGEGLLRHLEEKAQSEGHTEIVLNSGPRYAKVGWMFWKKQYGEPVGIAEGYYESKYDAMVWRKELDPHS